MLSTEKLVVLTRSQAYAVRARAGSVWEVVGSRWWRFETVIRKHAYLYRLDLRDTFDNLLAMVVTVGFSRHWSGRRNPTPGSLGDVRLC